VVEQLSSKPVATLRIHGATRFTGRIAGADCDSSQYKENKSQELVFHYREILCKNVFRYQLFCKYTFHFYLWPYSNAKVWRTSIENERFMSEVISPYEDGRVFTCIDDPKINGNNKNVLITIVSGLLGIKDVKEWASRRRSLHNRWPATSLFLREKSVP